MDVLLDRAWWFLFRWLLLSRSSKVVDWRKESLDRFSALVEQPSNFQALVLVSCKATRTAGSSQWEPPVLEADLWFRGEWQSLKPEGKKPQVRKAQKKPAEELLGALEWRTNPEGGPKVALVSHFLKELGKPRDNVGKYCEVWKTYLEDEGEEALQLPFRRLPLKAGSKPWVGTKTAFRKVYQLL